MIGEFGETYLFGLIYLLPVGLAILFNGSVIIPGKRAPDFVFSGNSALFLACALLFWSLGLMGKWVRFNSRKVSKNLKTLTSAFIKMGNAAIFLTTIYPIFNFLCIRFTDINFPEFSGLFPQIPFYIAGFEHLISSDFSEKSNLISGCIFILASGLALFMHYVLPKYKTTKKILGLLIVSSVCFIMIQHFFYDLFAGKTSWSPHDYQQNLPISALNETQVFNGIIIFKFLFFMFAFLFLFVIMFYSLRSNDFHSEDS